MFVATTIDQCQGSPCSAEHWVHEKDGFVHQYKCGSRAEAEELAALLNLTTTEQRRRAVEIACNGRKKRDAA